jgi:hypothetical protein
MNKLRRKAIEDIQYELGGIFEQLEALRDEEQMAYDNMPEGLQESERGEKMYEAIEGLESATQGILEICDSLSEVIN